MSVPDTTPAPVPAHSPEAFRDTLAAYDALTGLKLLDATGGIRDELPPITTFLNRLLALTLDLQAILFTAFEGLLAAKVEGAIAAGHYDQGLETLTAESFTVTHRTTIYTHPGTGAETRLLTIAEHRRNRPMTTGDALAAVADGRGRLLVNERSGRAAVQVAAPSLMLDDGEIERRVRLLWPTESHPMPAAALVESQWEEVDRAVFIVAWEAELAEVPAFTEHVLHVVCGLLLPVWKRLPDESTRVYRLQTDEGERIVGRRVPPAWAATAASTGAPTLTSDQAYAALVEGRTILDLAERLQLRRVRVMAGERIELTGFTEVMRERMRAYGLFTEIISWKLRFFVPVGSDGPAVLGRLLDTYPIARVAEREVA